VSQLTAKSVEDVLRWVETTPHHFASAEDPKFFVLKGHGATLRIPEALRAETARYIEPGKNFDTRMYRATKAGRARLRRADRVSA
jgi:hypothetical protein